MQFFRRKAFEKDMDAEMRFHMEAYAADLVRSGLSPEEANRRARLEFGAMDTAKDDCRQAWGLRWLDELRADLRLSFRSLAKAPGFAAIAVVSLAIGIGANTAIFGLVDAVLLRTLPVRAPQQLVFIVNVGTQGANGGPPYPCFELLRSNTRSFQGMSAYSASSMELIFEKGREQVRGLWVSGDFYDLLGVKAIRGRSLSAADDSVIGKGGPDGAVAVISEAYWQQRFGGDPRTIGSAVRMNERVLTIIGVLPTAAMSVEPGRAIDIAVPIALSDPRMLRERSSWWLDIVARLKPGVNVEAARAESDALYQAYMADVPLEPSIRKLLARVELPPAARGTDGLRSRFAKPLTALLILSGLVLLAACANVANLMLARASAREREFAVRVAMGARRGRLIRQTLTEAAVLVGMGAALGIAIANWGAQGVMAYFADGTNPIVLNVAVNDRMLLFTLIISIATGLLFGLLPALRSAGAEPSRGMRSASRSFTGSRATLRAGRTLVVVQVALCVVLLAGAGLFVRTVQQLRSVDLGFRSEGMLTMEVAPEKAANGSAAWLRTQSEILARVREMSGVLHASWSTMTPLSGRDRGVWLEVPGFVSREATDKVVHLVSVSPQYFETLGLATVRGRAFTPRDDGRSAKAIVLNETAARYYFGEVDPIGKFVSFEKPLVKTQFEVVGIAKDTKHRGLREEPMRFAYLPMEQSIDKINRVALSIRTSSTAAQGLASIVTREIREADSSLLITNVSTLEKQIDSSMLTERLVSTLSTAFGAMALVLACIGLYGVLAYAVVSRRNEFGIRMALGATRGAVIWPVAKEALLLALSGIAIGLPAVALLGGMAKALLYGVEAFDVPTMAVAVAVLVVFASVAAAIPAWRASRLDPMIALRCD